MNPRKFAAFVAIALALWAAATWIVLRIWRVSVATYYRVQGIKTYIIGTAYIAHAVLGWWLGDLQPNQAADRVLEGLGAMSLRAGMSKTKSLPAPAAPIPVPPPSDPLPS